MSLPADLKHPLRVLTKAPGFAIACIVVLALGIGVNTAIFSIVHAVLLRPLPFGDAEQLVQLWHTPPKEQFPGVNIFSLSAANYLDWEQQNTVFEQSAVYRYEGDHSRSRLLLTDSACGASPAAIAARSSCLQPGRGGTVEAWRRSHSRVCSVRAAAARSSRSCLAGHSTM